MKWKIILLAVVIFGVYSCSSSNKSDKKESVKSDLSKYVERGASISKTTAMILQKNLKHAVKSGGFDTALSYCHKKAMFLQDSLSSAYGVKIKRVAGKNRNPFDFLDAESATVFNEYEKLLSEGKPLKPKVVVNAKGNPVYYAPIILNKDACLKCHGMPGEQISENRLKMIKKYYPEDKATGFKKGDLRGMWQITFVKDKVK